HPHTGPDVCTATDDAVPAEHATLAHLSKVPHHRPAPDPRGIGHIRGVDDTHVSALRSVLRLTGISIHCHRSSGLIGLQVRRGGSVAEDQAGSAGPVL